MRRITLLAALAISGAFLPAAASAADRGAEQAAQVIPGSYIVTFEDSVGDVDTATAAREGRLGFAARFRYAHAIKGFSARLNDRQLAELHADPDVASIDENRVVRASAESIPTGIRRIGAYEGGTANGAGAPVAVIDTGVDLDHPDLNVTAGTNCVGSGPPDDDNGHGSHVAGTIGATNTGSGVIGVAPGTQIHAVKVLDRNGSGSWDQVVCGINWVAAHASTIEAANMSLGGLGTSNDNKACGSSTALHNAICNATSAGVRFAVAAGNSAWEYPHPTLPDVPAAYRQVVTVAAMSDSDGLPGGTGPNPSCRTGERDDRTATFSNYSDNATDNAHTIAAPGVCINSTWMNAGYTTISGTSMATPHVAGAIALCAAAGSCPTNASTLVSQLDSNAAGSGYIGDPSNGLVSPYFGWMTIVGSLSSPPSTPTGTFELSAPSSVSVARKQTAPPETINLTGDYTGTVSLSVSGAAKGVTATLSPTSSVVPGSSTLTVKGGNRPTTLNLTITGTGGTITRTATVTVTVT